MPVAVPDGAEAPAHRLEGNGDQATQAEGLAEEVGGQRPHPDAAHDGGAHRLVGGEFEHHLQLLGGHPAPGQRLQQKGAGAGARLTHHPVGGEQFLVFGGTARPRVGGRRDEEKLVLGHRAGHQQGRVDLALDEAEIDLALGHHARDLGSVAHHHLEVDVGPGLAELGDAVGQPDGGDGLARGEHQAPPLEPAQIGERPFGGGGAGEHGARLFEKDLARLAQHDVAPDPMKELHPEAGLEGGDRRAHRRLGEVQRLSRPGDVLAFGDGDENAELFERHGERLARNRHPSQPSPHRNSVRMRGGGGCQPGDFPPPPPAEITP